MISVNIKHPTVTLAIPTYNESLTVENVIKKFLATEYSNLIEIFVADGGSTDDTQMIVHNLSLVEPRVKLIHNPLKIQAAGKNLILQESTGEIFIIADAHSDYAPDYIEKCVEVLLKSEALNVGGAQRFVAKTPFQVSVALASKSFLGSGGAKYRDPDYNGYADTVYLGCFWRKTLLDVSGFDISQFTNEDAELNQKLLQKSQKAIYISSEIGVWYYPRKTWKSICIQYFKYGRGRYLTTVKHKSNFQLRGKLPFLVISSTGLILLIDIIFPQLGLPIRKIILFSLFFPLLESLRIKLKFRKKLKSEVWRGNEQDYPSNIYLWLFCAVILLTMPFAHFSGYTYQIIRSRVLRISKW
ncbi:MAG: glycosyltransferase family 2 protein [Nostoc sp.]|uniref:glycosyltransferase family 2 protein n=1 Tax=Nostoc sp. TaxID=1180 RepID=UPI002FF99BDE